ncbi:hypothetical protein Q3G72_003133 [Acer saccharum]|nr:hypothetical protein Q3G72_003133 [Acer saccharum]
MLNGYVISGESENAIGVFKEMRSSERKPNSLTFAGILSLCATEAMIDLGIQLHGSVVYFRLEFDSPVIARLLLLLYEALLSAIYVDCILWDAFYTSDYTAQVLLGYCMVYIFMQTFMIPGTVFMSLLSGALFSVFKGVALVVFTATAGWISSLESCNRWGVQMRKEGYWPQPYLPNSNALTDLADVIKEIFSSPLCNINI